MAFYRTAKNIFITLVFLTLLTPLVLFRELLYPFITSKAFFSRSLIELILPFYLYLIFSDKILRPRVRQPLTLAILTFLFVSLAAAVFGKDFTRSFWGNFERMDSVFSLAHLTLLYFYLLLLAKLSEVWLERFLKALPWVSAASSLNGILGFLGGPTLTPDTSLPERASSTFGNPIFFASFLVLPLCLSAFFALRAEKRKEKILHWLLAVLQFVAMVLSGTRGAMVGLAGGGFLAGVVYLFLEKNRKIRARSLGGLAVMIVLAVILIGFSQKLPQGGNLRRLLTFKDSNTEARLIQWKMALQGFKDAPLLGVGPNNYYVISNRHYDLKIRQYDPSWFDKPHNYPLELLTTGGILGLFAYAAVVTGGLWALFKAFKYQLLTLSETAVLFAGFTAYQIQNFFVFDTVSASLAFFTFLGFLGYLLHIAGNHQPIRPIKSGLGRRTSRSFLSAVLWAGIPAMLYMVYATNIIGFKIAKALNLAKIFQAADFDAAKRFLDSAANSPFNFYWRDTGYEYSNLAAYYSNRNQSKEQLGKSKMMMKEALAAARKAVEAHKNDPTVWMKLANALFAQSHLENTGFNQAAYDAAFRAHELAPKKHDPKLFMAELAIEGKKNDLAEKWLLEVLADFPDLQDVRWQLADVYYFSGKKAEAVNLAEAAGAAGFKLDRIKKADWLLTDYYDRKQPQKAVEFLLSQSMGKERDADYFARLADAYKKSARFTEARVAALKVLELDPGSRTDVEAFLRALPR